VTERPFLLISTRAEDELAADELRAVRELSGLGDRVLQWRLERDPLPAPSEAWLNGWAGILLGGSPFTSSDPERSELQVRVEDQLEALVAELLARDQPFLGLCYGVGILGRVGGGSIDRRHGEPVGATWVSLTPEGARDPLLVGVPERFEAFVGHKEATATLPADAVLLASSAACPVQMYRMGRNVYATQFHPELDAVGLATRIEAYKHLGYFDPSEAGALTAVAHGTDVHHAHTVLRNFARLYG